MKKVFWFVLAVALLLPFSIKVQASVLRTAPDTTYWYVVGHNPTTVSPIVALKALHLANEDLALITIATQFPDTIWVKKFDYFPAMTFGAGHVCRNVYALFDIPTKAIRWKLRDGTEIIMVLACNNVAWRRTEVGSPEATIVPAPVEQDSASIPVVAGSSAKMSGVTLPWQNWLAGLGILLLLGLIAAFLVWLFRQIFNGHGGTPVAPPTTTTTAPVPPTPDEAADDFNAALGEHDDNIQVLNRLLDREEAEREALIDDRLVELNKTAQATDAERARLQNLRSQQ